MVAATWGRLGGEETSSGQWSEGEGGAVDLGGPYGHEYGRSVGGAAGTATGGEHVGEGRRHAERSRDHGKSIVVPGTISKRWTSAYRSGRGVTLKHFHLTPPSPSKHYHLHPHTLDISHTTPPHAIPITYTHPNQSKLRLATIGLSSPLQPAWPMQSDPDQAAHGKNRNNIQVRAGTRKESS